MKVTELNEKRKQAQRANYKNAVLNAFDALFPKERQRKAIGKPQRLDTDPEVRLKAKLRL